MKTTIGENRGVKSAQFYVLKKTKIPAVLIECGFLTNPHDAAIAARRDYRDRLAREIANAIVEFHSSKSS